MDQGVILKEQHFSILAWLQDLCGCTSVQFVTYHKYSDGSTPQTGQTDETSFMKFKNHAEFFLKIFSPHYWVRCMFFFSHCSIVSTCMSWQSSSFFICYFFRQGGETLLADLPLPICLSDEPLPSNQVTDLFTPPCFISFFFYIIFLATFFFFLQKVAFTYFK